MYCCPFLFEWWASVRLQRVISMTEFVEYYVKFCKMLTMVRCGQERLNSKPPYKGDTEKKLKSYYLSYL